MKKTNDLFPTWIRVPAQIFPTVNKWKKKSHRHRNASGDERVARKRGKKNVFSLSLSPERDPCITQVRVLLGLILTPAAWKFYLLFFWPTSLVTHDIRERDEANTKKKPRVASVREWQTGKLLLFRPPIEEGERKTPEKTKHTCRDSISFFFAFGNPGYTFRVF